MKTLITAILLVFTAVMPASADQWVFGMNGWEGRRVDTGGYYSHCKATIYKMVNGKVLVLAVSREGSLSIIVRWPVWSFRPGATVAAEVMIDGKMIAGRAQATDIDMLQVVFTDPAEIQQAQEVIASGSNIVVRTSSAEFLFPLKVPDKVLEALVQCNEKAVAEEFHAPEPGPVDAARKSTAEPVDKAEAMIYVVNLLAAAGISGQVYLRPSEYRDILPEYDVVWKNPDDTLGAAALYVNARRGDLDIASSNILSGEAAFCKGDFASGVKKKEQSEKSFRKELFTTCDMGGLARETYYVLYVTDKGLLMAVGTIALTSGQHEVVEETGAAIARGAQLSF